MKHVQISWANPFVCLSAHCFKKGSCPEYLHSFGAVPIKSAVFLTFCLFGAFFVLFFRTLADSFVSDFLVPSGILHSQFIQPHFTQIFFRLSVGYRSESDAALWYKAPRSGLVWPSLLIRHWNNIRSHFLCVCDAQRSSVSIHWERFEENRKCLTQCGVTVVLISPGCKGTGDWRYRVYTTQFFALSTTFPIPSPTPLHPLPPKPLHNFLPSLQYAISPPPPPSHLSLWVLSSLCRSWLCV